ncbi:MAG: nucleotidyltransferase domain-containing protein [Candidatus Helarchaeota archaeon]|nr:nucleotidyltransferase domain-containing protein [Candidatus Helarchaeota archaeon]
MKFRDRDFLITNERIIFRVYGYCHPDNASICDVEYAPSDIYKSDDIRAIRGKNQYFKFYFDGGLKFIQENYPQYQVFYRPLNAKLVGLTYNQVSEVRKPEKKLQTILASYPKDILVSKTQELIDFITQHSTLKSKDFGVFGSILHDFYHVEFSDIDLIIYGRKELEILREILREFYKKKYFDLRNEFNPPDNAVYKKNWRYTNYSLEDYIRDNARKQIYAIIDSKDIGRKIKIEFEPVKKWNEIENEYNKIDKIIPEGWIKATARITDSKDAFYIQSIYEIEIEEIILGPQIDDIKRIVNYLEEFRGQAQNDEKILVEGHLEKIITKNEEFHQITLSYASSYHEQNLKRLE